MPQQHVLATRNGNRELRANQGAWPTGYAWADPSAIPPPGMSRTQRAGVLVTEHTLLQVDVVFTAMRIITTAILKMGNPRAYTDVLSDDNVPYRQYLRDQPGILTDTWGGRLMQYDGCRRTIMSMGLFGEAFWYVLERNTKGAYPSALDVLHPAFMEVKADDNGNPIYLYGIASDKKKLDPANVIHIPFMSMPQARRGLSTVEYAGVAGALAMAAYEFGSTWFSQGASPSFLLHTDQKLGQAEVERIASKFAVEHSGLSSAHLPLVLDSGLKADKIMTSPDEAQYLNTLEYARNVIGSWFGVDELIPNALQRQAQPPAHTAQERMQRFIVLTLSGYTVPMEEAFALLLPDGQKAAFTEEAVAQPDSQFLAQEVMALRQAQVFSVNDLRTRKFGLPPVPGGDDVLAPLASNTDQSALASGPASGSKVVPPSSPAAPPKP